MPDWIPLDDPCFKNPPAHRAQVLTEEVAPLPPKPERPSDCAMAMDAYRAAWSTWHNLLGKDAASYRVGTRSLTNRSEIDAWNALHHAIELVKAACGPGTLPPGIEGISGGGVFVIRAIPSDV